MACAAYPGPAAGAGESLEDTVQPPDELIEFLGAEDMGDAAWWEFLKQLQPPESEPDGSPETSR